MQFIKTIRSIGTKIIDCINKYKTVHFYTVFEILVVLFFGAMTIWLSALFDFWDNNSHDNIFLCFKLAFQKSDLNLLSLSLLAPAIYIAIAKLSNISFKTRAIITLGSLAVWGCSTAIFAFDYFNKNVSQKNILFTTQVLLVLSLIIFYYATVSRNYQIVKPSKTFKEEDNNYLAEYKKRRP